MAERKLYFAIVTSKYVDWDCPLIGIFESEEMAKEGVIKWTIGHSDKKRACLLFSELTIGSCDLNGDVDREALVCRYDAKDVEYLLKFVPRGILNQYMINRSIEIDMIASNGILEDLIREMMKKKKGHLN